MYRQWWIYLAAALMFACIEQGGDDAADDDPEGEGRQADGTAGGEDEADAGEDEPAGDAGAEPIADAGPEPPQPLPDAGPPPPPSDNLCEAYCQRVDECFAPACPALGSTDMLCRAGCRQPDQALERQLGLSCEEFNEGLFRAAPQLRRFCSDEPPPEGCMQICDFAEECDSPGGRDQCLGLCRTVNDPQRECLLNAESCQAFGACLQGPQPPNDRQRCEAYCNRQAQCIFRECAAGTLPDGYSGACQEECNAEPPAPEGMAWVFEQVCDELIDELREREPEVDARCDAEPDRVCATLCEETIEPCTDLDAMSCREVCADFDQANLNCLQFAQMCGDVRACFGDEEGQARCERFCGRLQGCLEEACPPRVIPPELSVNCTAGCLNDPPDEEQVVQTEEATCREVRQFVYRGNRQLAPICEGGRDFRPSPEECTAFCDNGLQACIGLGGRNFCLAACASLTRDEYQCALEAQGDCEQIGECLADEED